MNIEKQSCHVMAKPSGSKCNLDCHYCFYLEKDKLYPEKGPDWRMDDATLDAFIFQQIEAQQGQDVVIAWQGGEPTLLGLEFYRRAIEIQKKYQGDKVVSHSFQTNGVLLNDEWCLFFKEHDFLIGLSMDGDKELHDYYRVTRAQKGSHSKVIEALELLQKHRVEYNLLCVVNNNNANHPLRIYNFFKGLGATHYQFIPLLERQASAETEFGLNLISPDFQGQSSIADWSVSAKQYGDFLIAIFDEWISKDVGRISVQMFETTMASWLGIPALMCIFSQTCGSAFALESNGDLYACDHFVYPQHKLGNIHDTSIKELNNSEQAIQFGNDKYTSLSKACQQCEYQSLCYGGCPKHRISKHNNESHNYFCESYFNFFKHSQSKFHTMKWYLEQGYSAAHVMYEPLGKPVRQPRNEMCLCGSNKKYKHCCGN